MRLPACLRSSGADIAAEAVSIEMRAQSAFRRVLNSFPVVDAQVFSVPFAR